jgi:hypothetical protein
VSRDTVVNTLLGLFLLTVALFIFLAFVAALGLAIWTVEHLAEHFFPGSTFPSSAAVLVIYSISSLAYGLSHLRGRRWRNAFLCLAAVPVIVSIWFADPHSPFGRDGFVSIWLTLMVLLTPEESLVPRFELFLSATIVSAVVVVNSGFAGSDVLAHVISNCTLVAAVILLIVQTRRNQIARDRRAASL